MQSYEKWTENFLAGEFYVTFAWDSLGAIWACISCNDYNCNCIMPKLFFQHLCVVHNQMHCNGIESKKKIINWSLPTLLYWIVGERVGSGIAAAADMHALLCFIPLSDRSNLGSIEIDAISSLLLRIYVWFINCFLVKAVDDVPKQGILRSMLPLQYELSDHRYPWIRPYFPTTTNKN